MESFLLTSHIVCFQGSLRGLVAAMSGNVDCVKIVNKSHCMFPGLFARFSGSHVWQCRLCQNTPTEKENYKRLESAFCKHRGKAKELGSTA